MVMTKRRNPEPVEITTDNIFADLGFPDAETHIIKAQLVVGIMDLMKKRHLKQADAARLFGLSPTEVSGGRRPKAKQTATSPKVILSKKQTHIFCFVFFQLHGVSL